MADPTLISQETALIGADDAGASTPQGSVLIGASDAETTEFEHALLAGADDAGTSVSQQAVTIGADDAGSFVHQFVLLVGRGREVVPPDESPVGTFTFGAGLGNSWFIALQLSDTGIESRDKVVKPVRVTGKTSRGLVKVYGYGPKEDIDVQEIEAGVNQKATLIVPDTAQVQQSGRLKLNLKNAMTHTIRIEGIWDGTGIPDRIDEALYEVAQQGIRR